VINRPNFYLSTMTCSGTYLAEKEGSYDSKTCPHCGRVFPVGKFTDDLCPICLENNPKED